MNNPTNLNSGRRTRRKPIGPKHGEQQEEVALAIGDGDEPSPAGVNGPKLLGDWRLEITLSIHLSDV